MAQKWNNNPNPTAAVVAPVTPTHVAIRYLFRDGIYILISLVILNWRSALVVVLPGSAWFRGLLRVVFWLLPVALSGRVLETLYKWRSSRPAAKIQDSVSGAKRKLYGLPPPVPRQEPLRQRRPFSLNPQLAEGASTPQHTPITPPQRYAGSTSAGGVMGTPPFSTASGPAVLGSSMLVTTPGGVAESVDRGANRTPMSYSYRHSPSYSPGAVVASPEQLNYYMDSLRSGGTAASPQQPDFMLGAYGAAATTTGAYNVASDQDQATSGVLPVGAGAPYYRMTWMPKKAAAVAAADTPTLTPSSPEEVEEFVVSVLRGRQDWLEVWTERLREWLAARVLQPLVAAVASAHEPVNALLQQFNQSPRLPPLPDILADVRSAGAADVDGVLRSLQTSLSQHVVAQPAAATVPKAKELLAAVNRYADLLAVMRGKRPSDILPPANTAYVWARTQQLAESSCLKDFCWNGGSAYAGRPWSADQLPNDSALVLYLFTAYLDAPGWQFTAPPNTQAEGVTQPLYLGTLAISSRSTGACSAILTYRPERHGRDMDALLALQLQSTNPLFCYLAAGRLMVLANYQYVAVFHAILFFLQYHKVRYNGAIGRQQMEDPDLALDEVVQPPPVGALVSLGTKMLGRLGWFA